MLDDIFRRGDELNEDPLHGFLVGLRLFAELMANLPANYPGCLAASFAYQDQLFNHEVRELNKRGRAAVAPALPRAAGADRADAIRRSRRWISRRSADMARRWWKADWCWAGC